jgi:hypothetical protein
MDTNNPATPRDFDEVRHQAEAYVRDEPAKAVGIAAVVGILLTVLPVGSLIFGIVRLALGLLKPALLVLGGMKAYEEIQKRYGV